MSSVSSLPGVDPRKKPETIVEKLTIGFGADAAGPLRPALDAQWTAASETAARAANLKVFIQGPPRWLRCENRSGSPRPRQTLNADMSFEEDRKRSGSEGERRQLLASPARRGPGIHLPFGDEQVLQADPLQDLVDGALD